MTTIVRTLSGTTYQLEGDYVTRLDAPHELVRDGEPVRVRRSTSPVVSVETVELHAFVHEHSAESPYCGAMVLRAGCGDTCGRRREDHA